MQMHHESPAMTQPPPRRGRPPTGVRKERLQVPLEPADYTTIIVAAGVRGETQAELGRALIKGEVTWAEVERAARKGRK